MKTGYENQTGMGGPKRYPVAFISLTAACTVDYFGHVAIWCKLGGNPFGLVGENILDRPPHQEHIFSQGRGIKQGCPLSGILFVLVFDHLLEARLCFSLVPIQGLFDLFLCFLQVTIQL